jgi:hypothetical protein
VGGVIRGRLTSHTWPNRSRGSDVVQGDCLRTTKRAPAVSKEQQTPFANPVGIDFLKVLFEQENSCEAETRRRIPELGIRAPACYLSFGTVLSLLENVASCFWGCRGGDHLIENLAGRVCACSRSSLRLSLFGFYDESLSLSRSIGEIANLLFLFNQDAVAFGQWRQSDKKQRKERFSPVKVRIRLESMDLPVLINERRYGELCEVATHPTPQTKPQAHNVLGIPSTGGVFQEAGLVVTLNELAAATAFALVPMPKLLGYDDHRRAQIKGAGFSLLETVGALDILNVKEKFAETWQAAMEECVDESSGSPAAG